MGVDVANCICSQNPGDSQPGVIPDHPGLLQMYMYGCLSLFSYVIIPPVLQLIRWFRICTHERKVVSSLCQVHN